MDEMGKVTVTLVSKVSKLQVCLFFYTTSQLCYQHTKCLTELTNTDDAQYDCNRPSHDENVHIMNIRYILLGNFQFQAKSNALLCLSHLLLWPCPKHKERKLSTPNLTLQNLCSERSLI